MNLNDRFFVFGEYHSAVKGSQIKEASNITDPILDEALTGWSVDDLNNDELEEDEDTGLDENSSKLFRALEMWYGGLLNKKTKQPAVVGVGAAPGLPKIPKGDTSTREEKGGTKRLIIHGAGGKEEYWKPTGAATAPPNIYDPEAEMLAAIKGLFAKVFAQEIAFNILDTVQPDGNSVKKAWGYFKNESWKGQPSETAIKTNVAKFLYEAAKHRASKEYAKLNSSTYSDKIKAEDKSNWSSDDYRDEYMFIRVLEAKNGDFAFANMGNNHLERLKNRFSAEKIPYVLADEFFGRYSKDAVDTKQIAYDNSPEFRENQRLVLWLKGALQEYPNLQQEHLDMLNNYDLGEFFLTGIVTKWEQGDIGPSGGDHHKPILFQFLKDLKKAYPNSDDFIKDLSFEEFGEFLLTEKIARWDAM